MKKGDKTMKVSHPKSHPCSRRNLHYRKDIKKKCYSRPQPSYLWRFKEGFKGGTYPIPRNKARTTWE
ncbi:unnamed protein product [Microthlaspi erraticum]|uniref:Uncharacterized protein n=1 Tax=Microthlaspi erraticum TaxID=1685480 RepID=A0A6D2I4K4_9BRAS|nr:unnamed protein product [Microthlaspi erraticum]CAA7025557.1 unnamed protein product [Microthlaspi erraticum]CAA7051434.1 unnamed protein product [Microthlaspi erraticum]CAA7051805.1 unnamed protein product [Microthlaspi erraticum]